MINLFRMIPSWGRWLFAILGTLLILGIFAVFTFRPEEPKRTETIGMILPDARTTMGWSGSHYQGMKRACDDFGVNLLIRENVSTEECPQAIEELIEEGAGMIFLCGNTYPAAAQETILRHEKTSFATIAVGSNAPNMTVFFARMHQGRYLAGALAAMRTKSGVIGYVASMPKAPVVREINAFTLGARRTNPNVRVVVAWTGVWSDSKAETRAVQRLVREAGADVLTYHQDDQAVPDTCDEMGIDYIGFNAWLPRVTEHYLGTVICRWDIYYRNIIQNYLKNELRSIRNRWIGVNEGAIALADVPETAGPGVELALANLHRTLRDRLQPIFKGPIRDTQGVLRVGEGEVLRDEALIYNMDWFVEGVTFLGE